MRNGCRERIVERKKGESILIGDAIVILVDSVERGRVRLRCIAPGSLPLMERERFEEIVEENRRAASSRIPTLPDLLALQEE